MAGAFKVGCATSSRFISDKDSRLATRRAKSSDYNCMCADLERVSRSEALNNGADLRILWAAGKHWLQHAVVSCICR